MSRGSTLILIGVLTIFVPFSGLPSSIRTLLAVILGASAIWIGFTLRTRDTRPLQAPVEPSSL